MMNLRGAKSQHADIQILFEAAKIRLISSFRLQTFKNGGVLLKMKQKMLWQVNQNFTSG
jgi:hypothetical protein